MPFTPEQRKKYYKQYYKEKKTVLKLNANLRYWRNKLQSLTDNTGIILNPYPTELKDIKIACGWLEKEI